MSKKTGTQAKPPKAATKAQQKKSASTVGNTPAKAYTDTFNKTKDCYKDRKKIADKCRDDKNTKQESKDAAKKAKPTNKAKLGELIKGVQKGVGALDGAAEKAYGYQRNAENGWIKDHCDHLWVKPAGANKDQFMAQINKLKTELDQGIGTVINQAGGVIIDKAKDAAITYGEKAVVREVASAASLVVPVVGEVVVAGMTIFNILDGVWTAGKTAIDSSKQAYDAYKKIDDIRQQMGKLDDVLSGKTSPTELWADVMTGVAYTNPCLQARRCQLVPFNQTEIPVAKNGKGCCPGQSGHHVMPSSMFKDCPDYKESEAPTICVEGTTNTHGSHGHIHRTLGAVLDRDFKGVPNDAKIDKDKAIDAGAQSVKEAFPLSKCDKQCLKAQLDSYYQKLKCEPKKASGEAKNKDTAPIPKTKD
jgi:hypothetical protein